MSGTNSSSTSTPAVAPPAAAPEMSVALIPERRGPDGPVTTRRLRRTVAVYGALAATGTAIAYAAGGRRLGNAGLGLVAPGGGFLSAGKPMRYAATQPAFLASLVLWLGSGNVLAPLTVWLGSAAASARGPVAWPRAKAGLPALMSGALVTLLAARQRSYRGALQRREERNEYLRRLGATSTSGNAAVSVGAAPTGHDVGELSRDQCAQLRFTLDRALQPIDEFRGFDKIEQFQTSSVRYQVTVAGYALSAIQYDYTPAFHGYLSLAQRNLIAKWQERICWAYWSKESLWGHLRYNPDPVPRDNIMLTGWLGYQLASYMSNTLDANFLTKGSLTFAHPSGKRFEYDFPSLTEALVRNFERSDFTLYPCEPNWIYALCNGFGILPLPIHDRLYGTDYTERVLPGFRRGFENEFLSVDGRTIGIRSAWTGLTVPAMTSVLSDASVIWQVAPVMPDIARRQYEILRDGWLTLNGDSTLTVKLSGWDKIDTGNYKRSNVSALLWVQAAASELGDVDVATAAGITIDRDSPPVTENGVRHYPTVSAQGSFALLFTSLSRRDSHFDRVNKGMPQAWIDGPILEQADYPDVLVARAVSDGNALDLVLRPGAQPGRQTLGIGQLRPGGVYHAAGAVNPDVVADNSGRAFIEIDLDDRHEVHVTPCP